MRDAIETLVPLVLAAALMGIAHACAAPSGALPRRVVTWPPIYGCVDPHAATCATPHPAGVP